MIKITQLLILVACTLMSQAHYAQTDLKIYNIFQTSCTFSSCHDHDSPVSGLDLQGDTALSLTQRVSQMRTNIYNKTPENVYAANKGWKLIDNSGNPARSFLFRKISGDLDPNISRHIDENSAMPDYPAPPLEDKDKELIRQWILYGAPANKEVVDTAIVNKFYRGDSLSFAKIPPKGPEANKGMQMHFGPFFLAPGGETEFYAKYNPMISDTVEINRVDVSFRNGYSHHFILYKYNKGYENYKSYGIREDNAHYYTSMVTGNQFSDSIFLPNGTAFIWEPAAILDFNMHFVNYSSTKVLACEVYVNLHTIPKGTAKQKMYTELYANTSIIIPNSGDTVKFEKAEYDAQSSDNIYVWALLSHTHKYGKEYSIFKRNLNGTKGEHLFDAACPDGVPACTSPSFDYERPPTRYFEPLLPIRANEGFIHTASYVNNGPATVGWGETSNDEMMVMGAFYTLDTAGLLTSDSHIDVSYLSGTNYQLYPNPAVNFVQFQIDNVAGSDVHLTIVDLLGRVQKVADIKGSEFGQNTSFRISTKTWSSGIYIFRMQTGSETPITGKFIVR